MALMFQTNKKYKNYLEFEFDLGANFGKYMNKGKLHEAGYDSYLTGICFGSMVKYLEVQNLVEFCNFIPLPIEKVGNQDYPTHANT